MILAFTYSKMSSITGSTLKLCRKMTFENRTFYGIVCTIIFQMQDESGIWSQIGGSLASNSHLSGDMRRPAVAVGWQVPAKYSQVPTTIKQNSAKHANNWGFGV